MVIELIGELLCELNKTRLPKHQFGKKKKEKQKNRIPMCSILPIYYPQDTKKACTYVCFPFWTNPEILDCYFKIHNFCTVKKSICSCFSVEAALCSSLGSLLAAYYRQQKRLNHKHSFGTIFPMASSTDSHVYLSPKFLSHVFHCHLGQRDVCD